MATILITNAAAAPDPIAARFSAAGHLVLIARDGDHAWQLMQQFHVDLLITDRYLPGLSADTLVQRLRAHPSFAELPIIVAGSAATQGGGPAWDPDPDALSRLPAPVRDLIASLPEPAAATEPL
jgi:CheY-like chemotaxis protein